MLIGRFASNAFHLFLVNLVSNTNGEDGDIFLLCFSCLVLHSLCDDVCLTIREYNGNVLDVLATSRQHHVLHGPDTLTSICCSSKVLQIPNLFHQLLSIIDFIQANLDLDISGVDDDSNVGELFADGQLRQNIDDELLEDEPVIFSHTLTGVEDKNNVGNTTLFIWIQLVTSLDAAVDGLALLASDLAHASPESRSSTTFGITLAPALPVNVIGVIRTKNAITASFGLSAWVKHLVPSWDDAGNCPTHVASSTLG